MKNFILYQMLLPSVLSAAIIMPLVAVNACVTVRGDTYTVDGYGSMTPTKDEMSGWDSRSRGRAEEKIIFEDSASHSFKSCKNTFNNTVQY